MLLLKYQFWKNVTSEKWNSVGLNTFTTYLSSLLGVFNPREFQFSEVTFFQNWYFSSALQWVFLVKVKKKIFVFYQSFSIYNLHTPCRHLSEKLHPQYVLQLRNLHQENLGSFFSADILRQIGLIFSSISYCNSTS